MFEGTRLPRRWLGLVPAVPALALVLLPARAELSEPEPDPLGDHVEELLAQPIAAQGKLSIVFVLDGLRPDCVNATDTPNLFRLRQEGVNFVNGHAVFPTVTRVNSPSISTGFYPGRAGVVSNSIYIPAIDPLAEINTGDWRVLRKLDEVSEGKLLLVKSLGERLQAAGKTLAAVSSGSSGSALLLNHRAPEGTGVLVNGYLEDGGGRVAWPDAANAAILARFGPPPPKSGPRGNLAPVDWTQDVLRDYVIPELKPDVVLNWITQPDGTHHSFGVGSPESLETIRNDDRNIGLLLERLATLGLADRTNIFVLSDHGFGWDTFQVNLERSLIDAGLKAAPPADDVVIASSTQVALMHVKDRDPEDPGHRPAPAGAALDRRRFHRRRGAGQGQAGERRRGGLRRGHLLHRSDPPGQPGAGPGHRPHLPLVVGEECLRPRGDRQRHHRWRQPDRPAHGQRQQPRQHEPLERAQHLVRLGGGLQGRRAQPGAVEQRGRDAHAAGPRRHQAR